MSAHIDAIGVVVSDMSAAVTDPDGTHVDLYAPHGELVSSRPHQ